MWAVVRTPGAHNPMDRGLPSLPYLTSKYLLDRTGGISLELVSRKVRTVDLSQYGFDGVAPSKGHFDRSTNPAKRAVGLRRQDVFLRSFVPGSRFRDRRSLHQRTCSWPGDADPGCFLAGRNQHPDGGGGGLVPCDPTRPRPPTRGSAPTAPAQASLNLRSGTTLSTRIHLSAGATRSSKWVDCSSSPSMTLSMRCSPSPTGRNRSGTRPCSSRFRRPDRLLPRSRATFKPSTTRPRV